MNGFQKVIKVFAICLAIFIIVNIFGWILGGIGFLVHIGDLNDNHNHEEAGLRESAEVSKGIVTGEEWVEWQDIDKIHIDLEGSKLIIRVGGDRLVVKRNNENNFRVDKNGDTLKIREKDGWFFNHNNLDTLDITIPDGMALRELDIDSGAGRAEIDGVKAESFKIDQGAGVLEITNSKFEETKISGGAGATKISSSVLNDLRLDAGVGKVELSGSITGNSKIECGIGEVDINLDGNKDDYKIRAEKGIGSIKIDGEDRGNDVTYGSGTNELKLSGGIGSVKVDFGG